jgi:glycosylphosphatidylinositol transamidase (GPIT) subunit GPI8
MSQKYLTYEEYQSLGGSLDESAFNIMERRARRVIDYITYNRVKRLDTIPDEVKDAMVTLINQLNTTAMFSISSQNGVKDDRIVQYSNSVETITFRQDSTQSFVKGCGDAIKVILPDWLTYRGLDQTPEEFTALAAKKMNE